MYTVFPISAIKAVSIEGLVLKVIFHLCMLTLPMHIRIPIIMDMNALINTIKTRPDYHKVGMILCHNGVVRGSSRDGSPVQKVTVRADRKAIDRIIAEQKERPGIIEILVEINEGDLDVGEDLLSIVVAGDIREHVIPVLTDTLNLIKAHGTKKTEHK
jgi:molybdopterin synthase catalytic subunit